MPRPQPRGNPSTQTRTQPSSPVQSSTSPRRYASVWAGAASRFNTCRASSAFSPRASACDGSKRGRVSDGQGSLCLCEFPPATSRGGSCAGFPGPALRVGSGTGDHRAGSGALWGNRVAPVEQVRLAKPGEGFAGFDREEGVFTGSRGGFGALVCAELEPVLSSGA